MFGRWGVKTDVTLHARPDSNAPLVAEIPAGTVVRALTGILYIRPARFVVNRRIDSVGWDAPEPMPYTLEPGDTILLFTELGELGFLARRPGTTDTLRRLEFDTPGYGCEDGSPPCDGHFATTAVKRWWVQIESPTGQLGWTIPNGRFAIMEGCAAEDFPDTISTRPQN